MDELDAWINKESHTGTNQCQLCQPKILDELNKIEKRLRKLKKRVPIAAIWRRLTELELLDLSVGRMRKSLQRKCHLSFYKYLSGRE